MPGKSIYGLRKLATKKPHVSHVYPTHQATHLIPDQLIPWLLAATLLLGLAMLTLALP